MIELKSVRTPTNGDRIRTASDEEIAEFILANGLDDEIPFCKYNPKCAAILACRGTIPDKMCKNCVLNWIKQPADDMSARGHENIGENKT